MDAKGEVRIECVTCFSNLHKAFVQDNEQMREKWESKYIDTFRGNMVPSDYTLNINVLNRIPVSKP